jgi:hypothetical protein
VTGPSILEHVAAHVPDQGPGLTYPAGYRLPDEQPVADGELRWAPGALEGVLERHTAHMRTTTDEGVVPLVRAARRRLGGQRARARLYAVAMRGDVLDAMFDVLPSLADDQDPRDVATARWLAFEGHHRGPVKLGIALLALGHDEEDRRRLLLLARHDELSSFVLRTLAMVSGDLGAAAYAVAQVAHGWGRVGAVDRLDLGDAEVRRWLVCGGYRNTVMDEYTAINAAHADLLGQLRRMVLPDPELVDGAVGIVQTLLAARLDGGPGSHIGDYPDAAEVVELLLRRLAESDLRRFQLARDTRTWLLLPPEDEVELPPDRRQSLLDLSEATLVDPEWLDRTVAGLADPVDPSFALAVDVGRSLGHDIFPAVFAALELEPGSRWWYEASTSAGPDRISAVVELAERHLIRDRHDEYGALVHHWAIHVLEQLPAERPGLGWRLVATALRSRQSDRWPAYRVLERWGRGHWPAEAENLLRSRLGGSTDELERKRLAGLLG